jgi:2-aminoadipate transaminase
MSDMQLAAWTHNVVRSSIQDMLVMTARPDIISFALGLPSPALFPTSDIAEALSTTLATQANALQYGPPTSSLKRQIVDLMRHRGVRCREEQIFLTTGAQQGMNLLARLLVNPGDPVLVEHMTYSGFQQAVAPCAPRLVAVPTDLETGMDVDAVERMLQEGLCPACCYTVPAGHNPCGVSMGMAQRAKLVALARKYQFPIIEDDVYGFLAYENTDLPPLRSLEEDWVLYMGSFSKILAPGLRVGWMVVPESLIPYLAITKEASDIDTATLAQRSVETYLAQGKLLPHIARLCDAYRERRDAMLAVLHNHMPADARWSVPTNGMFIWVELPAGYDTELVLKRAIDQEGIFFLPGKAFAVVESADARRCMRLNFSNCSLEQITEGIVRLGRVVVDSKSEEICSTRRI